MKKILFLVATLGLSISACLPASLQPEAAATPASMSEADLQATAAILSQQTLRALPSPTIAPTNTPVVVLATNTGSTIETPTQGAAGPTDNAPTPLPTATSNGTSISPAVQLPAVTSSATFTPTLVSTITGTVHPIFYGTLPPNLPFGRITLINRSKAEVYVSLQCTTKDGYKTILEYPVANRVEARIPAGKYIYVVWVGGNKITGSFGLSVDDEMTLTIYKDRVRIK